MRNLEENCVNETNSNVDVHVPVFMEKIGHLSSLFVLPHIKAYIVIAFVDFQVNIFLAKK